MHACPRKERGIKREKKEKRGKHRGRKLHCLFFPKIITMSFDLHSFLESLAPQNFNTGRMHGSYSSRASFPSAHGTWLMLSLKRGQGCPWSCFIGSWRLNDFNVVKIKTKTKTLDRVAKLDLTDIRLVNPRRRRYKAIQDMYVLYLLRRNLKPQFCLEWLLSVLWHLKCCIFESAATRWYG